MIHDNSWVHQDFCFRRFKSFCETQIRIAKNHHKTFLKGVLLALFSGQENKLGNHDSPFLLRFATDVVTWKILISPEIRSYIHQSVDIRTGLQPDTPWCRLVQNTGKITDAVNPTSSKQTKQYGCPKYAIWQPPIVVSFAPCGKYLNWWLHGDDHMISKGRRNVMTRQHEAQNVLSPC